MTLVLVEDRDGVRYLSMNRPRQHNAMNDALVDALLDQLEFARNADATVIVLRGEGPSFSSGRDTGAIGEHRERGAIEQLRLSQSLTTSLSSLRKPVIAALHGYVLGKACELALAADIRIAADNARIGLPEVDHGLVTDNGATTRITLMAGPSRAKYLLMTGTAIDAGTALSWGLVDRVVASSELHHATHELARTLAQKAPLALSMTKELVHQVHVAAIDAGMRSEGLAQLALLASEDRQEARRARREQRPPVFRNR